MGSEFLRKYCSFCLNLYLLSNSIISIQLKQFGNSVEIEQNNDMRKKFEIFWKLLLILANKGRT